MADRTATKILGVGLTERMLSVIVFSLYSSWILTIPFEGQVLSALLDSYGLSPGSMTLVAVIAHLSGLSLCGFFIRTKRAAKKLFLGAIGYCLLATAILLFPPSVLWMVAIVGGGLLSGGFVAAYAFYLRSVTSRDERIRTVADGLVLSNALMIVLSVSAGYLPTYLVLCLLMIILSAAFTLALRLPEVDRLSAVAASHSPDGRQKASIAKPLAFLWLFIALITINSGLMYRVVNPAYEHLQWLTIWYWALPYIVAICVMRNLPRSIRRGYMLYVAIAMIGLSFLGFMSLGRSVSSYLVVNTLMLGACGIYDLFWWSVLGEMIDPHHNPARVFGLGLAANVVGILLGEVIGGVAISFGAQGPGLAVVGLAVVCVSLAILPPLHMCLLRILRNHAYLMVMAEAASPGPEKSPYDLGRFTELSERETQVVARLLQGKTYRTIASELIISENTVTTHVKNIYSKLQVRNRVQKTSAPPVVSFYVIDYRQTSMKTTDGSTDTCTHIAWADPAPLPPTSQAGHAVSI